jgi:hypothetical protein
MDNNPPPNCWSCHTALDRVDHYGIEHTMLRGDTYGPVGVMDGGLNGNQYGVASEVDLRCGRCGGSLELAARQ